jgi:hypothetical protein
MSTINRQEIADIIEMITYELSSPGIWANVWLIRVSRIDASIGVETTTSTHQIIISISSALCGAASDRRAVDETC